MAKDKPGTCRICFRHYAYLWDHVKKNHLHLHVPLSTLAHMGFTACPTCYQPCQTSHGIKSHQPLSYPSPNGTSYGSPNESTIGLLEDLASNLPSGHSSPAQSEIHVRDGPRNTSSAYSPTPSPTPSSPTPSSPTPSSPTPSSPTPSSPTPSSPSTPAPPSYSLGTQGPTSPIYGDEHTPPPPDVADIPIGLGQDRYNTYQPRNKYLQQLFGYNHVQAKDHTFRGSQAASFVAAAARLPTTTEGWPYLGIQSEEFSTQYVLQHYPDLMLPPPSRVETDRAQEFLGQPDNRRDTPALEPKDWTIGSQGLLARFQDIDTRLLETIKHLQGSEDRRPLDQDLVALPTRLGGLGIPLYAEVAELAFQNSQAIADITLQRILPPKLFWRLPRAPSPAPSNTSMEGHPQTSYRPTQGQEGNLQEDGLEGDIDKATEEDTQGLDEQTTLGSQEQEQVQEQEQDHSQDREHQQLDPTSTGPARTIYRAAIDKLNRARLARVQQKLSLQQENVRIENSAFLGRRWLSAMPTSQPLLLSDMDVAAALSIRLLTSPEEGQDICRHCDRAYTFAHEDACRARTRQTIVKHNKVCQALTTALQTDPQNKVTLEPQGDYRGIRTDIRIDNPKGTTYLDVSIISLGKETARKDPNSTLSAAERAKKLKYQTLGRAFKPFILSQGGLLGKETSQTYKEFQSPLTALLPSPNGTSYGSPNESTIGLLEDLASNLPSGHSSPAQSEIHVRDGPETLVVPTLLHPPLLHPPLLHTLLSYTLPLLHPPPLGPTSPIYGDEHTPPPPDVADIPIGLGQDRYNTYQPRNKYLQQLFGYNHVQAKDHTFRGSQAASFVAAAARCASRYTRQPTEKHLLDFLLLPKAGLTLGIQSEEFSTQYVLQHYPDLMLPPPSRVETDRAQEFLGQPDNRRDTPL
ncbi:unnamed protein product [Aureobasidium vineae]|uniref:Uncharacterized protein n=1 Tax=Aureobasidium vineae TaxID=2773715 RepID=A0A9N8JGA3_9PEZI|nr:unnamed protein product [Aureobasidium vineae]